MLLEGESYATIHVPWYRGIPLLLPTSVIHFEIETWDDDLKVERTEDINVKVSFLQALKGLFSGRITIRVQIARDPIKPGLRVESAEVV